VSSSTKKKRKTRDGRMAKKAYFHFVHLGIKPDGEINYGALEEQALNRAANWFRYSPTCYLIYTRQSAGEWHRRIRTVPEMSRHSFLLLGVNIEDRQGWMPKDVWEWIRARLQHRKRFAQIATLPPT
jgi:hypothetical protein